VSTAGPLDLVRRSVHRARRLHDPAPSRSADATAPLGWRERLDAASVLLRRREYVLFVSHMRSYSTVLGHIFGSHPEISGYVELHRSYDTPADLRAMRLQVLRLNGDLDGRFVFDKLLHRRHEISDDILRRPSVHPIYALREPVGATKSLIAMGRRHKTKRTWYQNPRRAAQHAINRYADLVRLADRCPDAAVMFTDCLLSDEAATLTGLTGYLGLRSPLTPEYQQFDKTAKGGFGDPVGPIKAGRVVADRPAHDVELPAGLEAKLLRAYEKTSTHLVRRCGVVVGEPSTPAGSG